ncbi:MAG TPA: hypothetical protein VFG69_08470, partial [Nannocystaceae bacterium]|nr:hypothetical protein [Nannocystaceae bacterium]
MSDEGTARPFSPAELDAIEDALEQLHGEDAFVVGELPEGGDVLVRERLASYRAIGRLSRDVLSQYAAPSHVLDRVMALARETAVDPRVIAQVTAPVEAPAPRSWWARLRGAWTIPMVAAAAAIALVVAIGLPTLRDAETSGADTVASRSPAPTSAAARQESGPIATPSEPAKERLAYADEPADGEAGGIPRGIAALEEATLEAEKSRDRFGADDARAQEQQTRRASASGRADASDRAPSEAPAAKPKTSPAPAPSPAKP